MTYPQQIFDALRDHGPLTARAISRLTGAPVNFIGTMLTRLHRKGIVDIVGTGTPHPRGGPAAKLYALTSGAVRPDGRHQMHPNSLKNLNVQHAPWTKPLPEWVDYSKLPAPKRPRPTRTVQIRGQEFYVAWDGTGA